MAYPGSIDAITFGQFGSMYTDSTSVAITPPSGRVFAAITMLEEVTFDSSQGWVSKDSTMFFNTESTGPGTGGVELASTQVFPRGVTIYGKWEKINLTSGSIVAYLGV